MIEVTPLLYCKNKTTRSGVDRAGGHCVRRPPAVIVGLSVIDRCVTSAAHVNVSQFRGQA